MGKSLLEVKRMSRNWEDTFRSWSKPSSDNEQSKCENAERMVCDAIKKCNTFFNKQIEIFSQGSYRNNTNVKTIKQSYNRL